MKRSAIKRRKKLSPRQAYLLCVKNNLSTREMYKLLIGSKVR